MKETHFFKNQYEQSLEGMTRLLNKAIFAYNVYKQYPGHATILMNSILEV